MAGKLYNACTYLKYRIFRRPLRLHPALRRRVKQPCLTVVFLHGISATSRTWKTLFREAARDSALKDVEMVAFDLLGFGKSLHADWLKYDYAEYSRALLNSIRRLRPAGPIVIVAHSMGSLIVANFAATYGRELPLAQLILVSPPVLLPSELRRLGDQIYAHAYSSLSDFADQYPAATVLAGIVECFTAFQRRYVQTPAFRRSMQNVILNRGNFQSFTHLTVPTLLIYGHGDPLVLRQNLVAIADANPRYVKFQSLLGRHEITPGKRSRILAQLKHQVKTLSESAHAQ